MSVSMSALGEVIGDVYGALHTTPEERGDVVEWRDSGVSVFGARSDVSVDIVTVDGDDVYRVWVDQTSRVTSSPVELRAVILATI